ncbi:hypothetical protein Tco_1428359 [Tanacetum coccineum]
MPCTRINVDAVPTQQYILLPLLYDGPQSLKDGVSADADDIIFGSTKKSLCIEFEGLMHKKFQMSSMRSFDFVTVKTASTPTKTNKALLKDEEAEDVDERNDRAGVGLPLLLNSFKRTEAGMLGSSISTLTNLRQHLKKSISSWTLGSGSGHRRPTYHALGGGADAQTRFETASKKSYDPPLSEGNTSGSGEDSMEHQVDLTDFVPPTPHDSPLSGGHTPGSDEGRPNFNELINLCTQLSNRVLVLENSKTAQDLVIQKLKKRVKRLEKALRERTPRMKLFKIGTSRRKGLDKENVSKQGRKSDKTKPMFNDSDFDVLDDAMENVEGGSTAEQITTVGDTLNAASINVSVVGPSHVSTAGPSNISDDGPFTSIVGDIFEDEMTPISDILVAIRSARPRTTSVMIRNVEEEPKRATPVPTIQSQDKEEQAQFEKEQRITREKAAEQEAKDAALIEQMEDVQARMDADELLA